MNTNAVNIAVVDGKTITETTELKSNPQGHPVRIKAVPNGKYILAEGDKGIAPENITIKRVGKDLHIALEGSDPDQPQLIIEDFFETQGQLVGVAEDGAYHEYIASDAEQDHEAAFLMDGVSSPQVLGSEQLSGFDGLVAGTGMGWFWPALLGLGALALAGAVYARNHDDDDKHHDPLFPPTPQLDDVEDNVGDKTGPIENGGSTDDTTPTFSGTGTPGSTIVIKDGDKAIGEAVVGNDGKWTFTPETPLAEGDHNIVIVEKDPAGNESAPSPGFEFTIDITAPGQSMIKEALDDVGDHQGIIPQDGVTDDNTPTLKGTAEPDSTLEVFANGEKIGTTVVDHDGNWTFTPDTALADGEYSFTTVAVDAAGNRGLPSLPYDLIVDTRGELVKIEHVTDDAGSIVGELQNGGVTDDTTPTLSGQATPNTQVNIYDNGVLLGTVPVDANGQWTFTPDTPLNEGQHGFTATVVTPVGGESAPTPVFDLEIDTTAPGKPGADGNGGIDEVDDNVGLIQGPIENGGYTDDTTPTLSGGGQEPGDKVTIIDNGKQIGEAIVDESGNWSYTPDPALPDGDHDFTIIVTDPAGNASEESDPYKVIVDTQAPAAPAITSVYDDQGDQTGNLAQGSLTDDAQPDITGTAEPGSTVIIYDNGVEIGRAPVDETGQWTFTPTLPLANGSHDLTAKAEDKAGNISEPSDPFDFDLLAGGVPTAPAITGVIDDVGSMQGNIAPGGVTDDTRPTITGTGQPGTTVNVYDDGVLVGTGTVGSDGQWSVPLTSDLHENLNNLTAQTVDSVGNLSPETGIYPVILDTTPPAASAETLTDDVGPIVGTINDNDTTDDNTPTTSGTAEPGTTIIIYDKGVEIGRTPVKDDGSWSFTPSTPLADGDHVFSTIVEDAAGNQSPKSDDTHFTVDTSKVEISITQVLDDVGSVTGPLTNGGVTDDTTPTVNGQATPDSKVNIYDNGVLIGTTNSDASGKWTFTPATPLTEGDHSLTATVVTAAGGESLPTSTFNLEIDTTAPAKPGIGEVSDDVGIIQGPIADGGSTDDTTPTLSGGGQAPGDTVTIIDNGTIIGTAPVKDDGSWEFTPNPPLNDGDHDFTIIVTDPAGNASEESDPYKVIIDTQAPDKPEITSVYDDQGDQTGNIAKGSITDDAQPDIKGTAEPGSMVIIYDGGKEIGRAPVDANGDWSFTPTLPLINGPHDLTAKAEDLAGNVSEPSTPFDFNLIAGGVPPAPAITGALDDVGSKQGNISPGGVTDDKRPTISGTGEPGATVKVYADGVLVGTGTVKADGQWSVDLTQDLQENLNHITATTTNGAGNVSPETGIYPIIVDTTAPAASAETLTDDVGPIVGTIDDKDTTDDNTPTASGTAEPGTTVIIYDKGVEIGRAPVKDDGSWSFTPSTPLADGDHSFSTVVEDVAGNQSPKSDETHFIVDTSAVEISITQVIDDEGTFQGPLANGGVTDDTTPTMVGQATPKSTVNIYDNGVLLDNVQSDASGKWEYTPTSPLAEGDHSFTATVVTAAGGESAPTSQFNLEIDTTAPGKPGAGGNGGIDEVTDDVGVIQGPIAKDGTTDDSTPTLSGGNQEPGDTVIIKDNGTIIGTAPVKDDGSWEFTPNPPLNDGKHDFTIIVTDPAGNASEESDPYPVNIDTTAPAAQAVVDSIGKDSGANHGDFLTNDGTAGRLISGSLTAALVAGEKVQVSLDGGTTWLDAILNGPDSWSFVDGSSHSTGWEIQTRVVDLAGNTTTSSQSITLDTIAPDAPTAIEVLTDSVGVEFDGSQLAVGDSISLAIGDHRIDYSLTQADIDAGKALISVPVALQPLNEHGVSAAIVDAAGNDSQYVSISVGETTENFSSVTDTKHYTVGQTMVLATMHVKVLQGTTYVGTYSDSYPQYGQGKRLYFGISGSSGDKLEISATTPCTTMSFTTDFVHNPATYAFYDTAGNLLDTLSFAGNATGYAVSYTAPAGVLIGSVVAYTNEWGFLDNFKFERPDGFEWHDSPSQQTIGGDDIGAHYGSSGSDVFSLGNIADLANSTGGAIHGGAGIDTLKLTGKDQVLDLTQLGEKITSVEVIDLTGTGNNTLNLSLSDVLEQGSTSLFTDDGHVQMMVKGNSGDKVNLDDLLADGTDPGNWASSGNVTVGGVVYEVYRHDALDAELLVQQGVQTNLV